MNCLFSTLAPTKPLEETVTMDEPYRLSHQVHKPIIQEVKEIIQPYRNIVQQVKPVIEDIRTIVPKDSDVLHQHSLVGGIAGVINARDMMARRLSLKSAPGPAPHFQGKSFSVTRQLDSVKGSESQPKIQRRMQIDEQKYSKKYRPVYRRSPKYSKMQFGSSEPEIIYVSMLPKTFPPKETSNNNENQRLSDYFASKG